MPDPRNIITLSGSMEHFSQNDLSEIAGSFEGFEVDTKELYRATAAALDPQLIIQIGEWVAQGFFTALGAYAFVRFARAIGGQLTRLNRSVKVAFEFKVGGVEMKANVEVRSESEAGEALAGLGRTQQFAAEEISGGRLPFAPTYMYFVFNIATQMWEPDGIVSMRPFRRYFYDRLTRRWVEERRAGTDSDRQADAA